MNNTINMSNQEHNTKLDTSSENDLDDIEKLLSSIDMDLNTIKKSSKDAET
jgi:hypothetical protein